MTKTRILEICEEIQSLKERFGFSDLEWADVADGLRKIKARCREKNLYLGVVGEFSCGKSTFINALLGLDLLKEDILQGTTCAPTFVHYGERFDVIIHLAHGRKSASEDCVFDGMPVKECIDKAREIIFRYTADEKYAAKIESVEIILPIENVLFKSGIVLVDTPGINAENPRHQVVAEQTVRTICDTVLLLTPSNAPCSQTLVSFVRDKIGGMSMRCIGIATCLDRLRERERSGTVNYVKSRFESEGVPLADVHGIAACFVAHPCADSGNPEAAVFRSEFDAIVKAISIKTSDDRLEIVTAKLLELVHDLVCTKIKTVLDRFANELSRRRTALEKNKLADVEAYLAERREYFVSHISRHLPSLIQIREAIDSECSKVLDDFNYHLYRADGLQALKERTTQAEIKNVLESCKTNAAKQVTQLVTQCLTWAESSMRELNKEFNAEFRSIGGNTGRAVSHAGLTDGQSIHVQAVQCGDQVDAIVTQGAVKVGGAIAGVIVGSILLPGLGTIAGGVVGGWLGSLFGKSLDEYKHEAENNVRRIVDEWKPTLSTKLEEYALRTYPSEIESKILSCISQYDNVVPVVKEIVAQEIKDQSDLTAQIGEVRMVQQHLLEISSVTEK